MSMNMPRMMVYQVKPVITIKLKTRNAHHSTSVVPVLHSESVIQSQITQSGKSASMVGGPSAYFEMKVRKVIAGGKKNVNLAVVSKP